MICDLRISGDRRISGAQTIPISESDIRVNFKNPCKIIAAANATTEGVGQAQFHSSDGGATWSQTNLPLISGDLLHGDPNVDWTSDGTAWSITIGIDSSVTNLQLRSYKSTDGGASWAFDGTASGSQTAADKEMMWVDHSPTSPFKDNIYVIWHNNEPVRQPSTAVWIWQTPIKGGSETTERDRRRHKDQQLQACFALWPDTGSRKLLVASLLMGAHWAPAHRYHIRFV